MTIILAILSGIAVLALAPLFAGAVAKANAFFESRRGPSLFQKYYDLAKLFRKTEIIIPEHSSWIFRLTPYVLVAVTAIIAFIVPTFTLALPWGNLGDVVVLFGLALISVVFIALAGFDAGTAFGGLGSSREMFVTVLAEPMSLLVLFVISMFYKTTNITEIASASAPLAFFSHPSLFFAGLAFFLILVAENARIPVDNPSTHLELTMIHEAMILEYNSRYLGLIEYASMLKHALYWTIFFALFFPIGISASGSVGGFVAGGVAWAVKMGLAAFALGWFEKSRAKLRLFRYTEYFGIALLFLLVAILSYYYFKF